MDLPTVKSLLNNITYKDWTLWARGHDGALVVYATFLDAGDIQTSRKWLISPYATDSEVVQTVLKCVLTAEEHEAREAFRYKGAKIFGPHMDVDALAEFARSRRHLDVREAPVASI